MTTINTDCPCSFSLLFFIHLNKEREREYTPNQPNKQIKFLENKKFPHKKKKYL